MKTNQSTEYKAYEKLWESSDTAKKHTQLTFSGIILQQIQRQILSTQMHQFLIDNRCSFH